MELRPLAEAKIQVNWSDPTSVVEEIIFSKMIGALKAVDPINRKGK